ncbi:NACHT, LRR and PYD domains-containing protein 14 [Nowakowskiella sp. JEL0407]|nr:NACHT, LRR and PYD domains-containing protein 14 [Nowakowskiella sp. JEL0407]
MKDSPQHKLLVVYSSRDSYYTNNIIDSLRKFGFELLLDDHTSTYKRKRDEKFISNVVACSAIVILTSNSIEGFYRPTLQSEEFALKLEYAKSKNKLFFEVYLDAYRREGQSKGAAGRIVTEVEPFDISKYIYRHRSSKLSRKLSEINKTILHTLSTRTSSLQIPHPELDEEEPFIKRITGGIAIPPLRDIPEPLNYTERDEIWDRLDWEFEHSNICVLVGTMGSGKTYIATKYAHKMLSRGLNVCVMGGSSVVDIRTGCEEYVRWIYLGDKLAKNVYDHPILAALESNYASCVRRAHFVVIEDVAKYDDVSLVVNKLLQLETKVLITSTDSLSTWEAKIPSISVSDTGFYLKYLRRFLNQCSASDEECTAILDLVGTNMNRISVAAAYISANNEVTVRESISQIAQRSEVDEFPEVQLIAQHLQQQYSLTYFILEFAINSASRNIVLMDLFVEFALAHRRRFVQTPDRQTSTSTKRWQFPLVLNFSRKVKDETLKSMKTLFDEAIQLLLKLNIFQKTDIRNVVKITPIFSKEVFEGSIPSTLYENYAFTLDEMLELDDIERMMLQYYSKCDLLELNQPQNSYVITNVITSYTPLLSLKLSGTCVGIFDLFTCNPPLTSLDISGTKILDNAESIVGGLSSCKALKLLNISDCKITLGMKSIFDGLSHTSLKYLHMRGSEMNYADAQSFETVIPSLKLLAELHLAGTKLDVSTELNISRAISRNPSIQILDLSRCGISDVALQIICNGFKSNSRITRLTLSDNKITVAGWNALDRVLNRNKNLCYLDLSRNSIITGASLSCIGLRSCGLQTLLLSHNEFGDIGAEKVADCLKSNNTLIELSLNANHIGNKGSNFIGNCLKFNRTLKVLRLEANLIEDDGLLGFYASMEDMHSLLTLDLGGNSITFSGGKKLVNILVKRDALNNLYLLGTNLSAWDVYELRKIARKTLQIDRHITYREPYSECYYVDGVVYDYDYERTYTVGGKW